MGHSGDSEVGKKAGTAHHDERPRITKVPRQPGAGEVSKDVGAEHVVEYFPRDVEEMEMEHIDPNEEDSGEIETLPDGSLSIPILEEELVITKRVVVRERIIIRKQIQKEQVLVEADLRRERVSIVADPEVELRTGDSS
jgi:stress response protein YsnF